MKAFIVTPAHDDISGNSITAERWSKILRELGHDVSVVTEWDREDCDILIALHARRSHSSVRKFRQVHTKRPLIVGLSGTDLYKDLPASTEAQQSLSIATRVVALQRAALDELADDIRAKTSVIYQSAVPPAQRQAPLEDCFEVCVVGHLRDVKDPLRAAFASRLLPDASAIRVVQAGRALEAKWAEAARQEERENPRYHWIGEQSHEASLQLLSRARLFVLSSTMEGGSNAMAEAIVCGVPVLCSDIPGNTGMLDPEYAGYFPVGNTEQLASMLYRAETDPVFLGLLRDSICKLAHRFSPERESACWSDLLQLSFATIKPEAEDD